MKYIANPVEVEADQIERIIPGSSDSPLILKLAGGKLFSPSLAMMSRMQPTVGDYVVTQSDGYIYLNPKAVFERKYRRADEPKPSPGTLEVGINDRGEVIVNHPDIDQDKDGVGHIVFDSEQAFEFGLLILKNAQEARKKKA